MKLRNLVYVNMVTLIIMNLGNVCNYLFQILAGRLLTPADFGLFNALNSLATIGSIPVFVLPMVLSRYTVEMEAQGREYVARLLIRSTWYLCGAALVLLAAGGGIAPGIQAYLHVPTLLPAYLVIAYVASNLVRPAPWGILQGLERFVDFSIVGGGGSFARLVFGVLLLWMIPCGVSGAMWAGVLSNLVAWGMALWYLRDFRGLPPVTLPKGLGGKMLRFSLPTAASNVLLLMFGNLDIILAKRFCSPEVVGLYASAAVFGRIAYYVSSVLGNVLFPKAAKGDKGSLTVCLILTGGLAGGAVALSVIAGDSLASLLFGQAYAEAGPLFKIVTLGMGLLALSNVLLVYGLARQQYGFLWVQGGGVAVLAVSILVRHDSALDIAWALAGSCGLMLAGMIVWAFRIPGRREA